MAGYYNKEFLEQFMKEEQQEEQKRAKQNSKEKEANKKLAASVEKAATNARVAFEQTQQNRFEIEELKKSLHRAKLLAAAAMVIAVICAAMVMAEELAQLTSMLP